MGTAGSRARARVQVGTKSRTMPRDRRTDGWTDGRALRRDQIRGTVGGPSRMLASIHSPPNSPDLVISASSRQLPFRSLRSLSLSLRSFPPRSGSLPPRFPSSSRFPSVSSSLFHPWLSSLSVASSSRHSLSVISAIPSPLFVTIPDGHAELRRCHDPSAPD